MFFLVDLFFQNLFRLVFLANGEESLFPSHKSKIQNKGNDNPKPKNILFILFQKRLASKDSKNINKVQLCPLHIL